MENDSLVSEVSKYEKSDIDQDVLEGILSTLPPKSLMRFKSACTDWHSLLSSPSFVAKHFSRYSMHKTLSSTTSIVLKLAVSGQEVLSLLRVRDDNVDEPIREDLRIPVDDMSLESTHVIGHCDGIIALATPDSCRIILWNPAIHEFKLIPATPDRPDSFKGDRPFYISPSVGFGYDPKSNCYKLVVLHTGFMDHVKSDDYDDHSYDSSADCFDICNHSMQAVYTFGDSDDESWRASRSYSLETETTVIQPDNFQVYFRGRCYWVGVDEHKEINTFARMEEGYIKKVILSFDMADEIFDVMPLPYESIDSSRALCAQSPSERLLVWKDSLTLCATYWDTLEIWVIDELADHWTKHFTIETSENSEKLLFFLEDNEILMAKRDNGQLFSYNYSIQTRKYLPVQMDAPIPETPWGDIQPGKYDVVSYVDSIVPLSPGNKLNKNGEDFSFLDYFSIRHSMRDKTWYSYSVWAFPPNDVSLRIKKVMDGLRAEFGGPEIEPHIPIVSSIRMTHDLVLSKFGSLKSEIMYSYEAKVRQVVSRKFYYQCVCLLIDYSAEISDPLQDATEICSHHFNMSIEHRPRLSLLYGYLTEEQKKKAQEKVGVMDENITGLSFPITRLGLYKVNYRDTTLKSWEKVSEYNLVLN